MMTTARYLNSAPPDLLFNADGTLCRPLDAPPWFLPTEISLIDARLEWIWVIESNMNDPVRSQSEVMPSPEMLAGFIKLAAAPDDKILQFARTFGLLDICSHGLPSSHSWQNRPGLPPPGATGCRSLGEHTELKGGLFVTTGWEPIAVWRHFARQARALLSIAKQLHDGRPGLADDWRTVYEWTGRTVELLTGEVQESTPPEPETMQPSWSDVALEGQRLGIELVVADWLCWGAVTPSFTWTTAAPRVQLGGSGLFGALAVQLMLAISSVDGLAICSGCALPYIPGKQPASSRRRYCDDCRNSGVPLKHAARDYRRREKRRKKTGGISDD